MFRVLAVLNLAIAAVWLGSMAYSLRVVQPRIARYFDDDERREDFLVVLANGNRWPVVGLVSALIATGAAALAPAPSATVRIGYGIALALYAVAAGLFWYVSWRHWPARIFALPAELPAYRRRLRILATTMTILVGAGFLTVAAVSVGP